MEAKRAARGRLPWVIRHAFPTTCSFSPTSASGTPSAPVVSIHPPQLTMQPGQTAEFRCSATGHPTPTLEWTGETVAAITFRAWLSWMWEAGGRILGCGAYNVWGTSPSRC